MGGKAGRDAPAWAGVGVWGTPRDSGVLCCWGRPTSGGSEFCFGHIISHLQAEELPEGKSQQDS